MDVVLSVSVLGMVPSDESINHSLQYVLRMRRGRREVQVQIHFLLEGLRNNPAIVDRECLIQKIDGVRRLFDIPC